MVNILHKLIQKTGDNFLIPDRAALVVGFMDLYGIHIPNIIVREICNRDMSTNTSLDFPCMLVKFCLDDMVLVLSNVDNFMIIHWTTYLGLIWDHSNMISRVKVFWYAMHMDIETLGFTDLEDT